MKIKTLLDSVRVKLLTASAQLGRKIEAMEGKDVTNDQYWTLRLLLESKAHIDRAVNEVQDAKVPLGSIEEGEDV